MKILIVQLGRIGDMILLTPAIDAIKCKYPTSQLDILAGRHNYQAIKNNPSIDNIIVYEKSPLKLCKTLSTLLKTKYDYYIDPKDHKSSESKILATIARAKLKIGLNIDSSKVFDCSIPSESDNQGLHFSQRAFRALNHLSIETPAIVPKPFLYNTQDSLEYVDSFINAEQLDSFIVLNLSASMEHKMWDTENWIRLFKEFEYMQEKTVLSYAPAEKEKATLLLKSCPRIHNFKSKSLHDAIALISKSDLLISPDTAMVHVAAAFNIPLLGLYSGLDDFYDKFFSACDHKIIIRATKGDYGIKSIEYNQVKAGLIETLTLLQENKS